MVLHSPLNEKSPAVFTAGDGLVLQELGVLGRVFAAFGIRRGIRHGLGFVLDGLGCLEFLIRFSERLLDQADDEFLLAEPAVINLTWKANVRVLPMVVAPFV